MHALADVIEHWAVQAAAIAAGLAALVYMGKTTRRVWRGMRDFLRRVTVMMDLTDTELRHNHGSSIKDAVSQIPQIHARVGSLENRLDAHLGRIVPTDERARRGDRET